MFYPTQFCFALVKEAIIYFGQNKMDDCLATCWDVCARATRHNSGNWPFLLTKAFYIISAVYRQAKEFGKANEYMEKSSEVSTCTMPLFEIFVKISLTSQVDRLLELYYNSNQGFFPSRKTSLSRVSTRFNKQ